jgi:hypothetical protein
MLRIPIIGIKSVIKGIYYGKKDTSFVLFVGRKDGIVDVLNLFAPEL